MPALELPTDRPRPATRTHEGVAHPFELGPELSRRVRELAAAAGATPFMTLLAAFRVLLARYSGQGHVGIGTLIANRRRREAERLIGFFANTLVLRTDASDDPSFRELIGRERETALDAYAHQDLPFEKLVEELSPRRDLSRTPLFQVMFILQNAPGDRGRDGAPAAGPRDRAGRRRQPDCQDRPQPLHDRRRGALHRLLRVQRRPVRPRDHRAHDRAPAPAARRRGGGARTPGSPSWAS